MKTFISIAVSSLVILFTSCSSKTDTPVKIVSNADLLAMFEEIQPDNLHVWAKCDKPGGAKFQGKQLDTTYFPLFGSYMNGYKQYSTDPKTHITKYSGSYLYACYKFNIDDSFIGLIVRGPSQYEESAIDLWICDKRNNRLIKSIELADSFGDENWYFNKESWIKAMNNSFLIISRKIDHEINETTSIDRVTSDSLAFTKLASDKVVKVDLFGINKADFKMFSEK